MKKISITTIACLISACCLFGQYTVERQVIASAGGYGLTASHQVSWTLGEVATATFIGGSFRLTQGFQQPGDLVNASLEQFRLAGFKFYPNPAHEAAQLELDMPFQATLHFRIIDVSGRTLIDLEKEATEGLFRLPFDLSALVAGPYFLQISDTTGERLTTIRFVRM